MHQLPTTTVAPRCATVENEVYLHVAPPTPRPVQTDSQDECPEPAWIRVELSNRWVLSPWSLVLGHWLAGPWSLVDPWSLVLVQGLIVVSFGSCWGNFASSWRADGHQTYAKTHEFTMKKL